MKRIVLNPVSIRDLCEGYEDDGEEGVVGYGGKLNIRPKYQRNFVYEGKRVHLRNAVIDTVTKGFPLNSMYWADIGGGKYEVIDGQQRIISICQYVDGVFSVLDRNNEPMFFENLSQTAQDAILDYELMVYFCEGKPEDKLVWFRTINIAGAVLSEQEMRNATYSGPWVTDAKRYFSRRNNPASRLAGKYTSGDWNRQELLETAIKWMQFHEQGGSVEDYMAAHQKDGDAKALWSHFEKVIEWVEDTFIGGNADERKPMKSVNWGELYTAHGNRKLNPKKLRGEVERLMADEDVTSKKGIYCYVLDGKEKHLSIREFKESEKRTAYERQKGVCPDCEAAFDIAEMEADHITPWSKGGKTEPDNCCMRCAECNRRKSNK